jgi:SEC-C motif-containing protein
MRSRYTAYHTGQAEYLIATRHPSKRQFDDRITLRQSLKTTTWLSLHILSVRQGQPQDTVSQVEFVAIYRAAAQALGQLHERSTFVQQQGRWFYLEGTMLPPHRPKRQEPCWCGSGKKFKQCHGL